MEKEQEIQKIEQEQDTFKQDVLNELKQLKEQIKSNQDYIIKNFVDNFNKYNQEKELEKEITKDIKANLDDF